MVRVQVSIRIGGRARDRPAFHEEPEGWVEGGLGPTGEVPGRGLGAADPPLPRGVQERHGDGEEEGVGREGEPVPWQRGV